MCDDNDVTIASPLWFPDAWRVEFGADSLDKLCEACGNVFGGSGLVSSMPIVYNPLDLPTMDIVLERGKWEVLTLPLDTRPSKYPI
jgi:hypothetical protein